MGFYRKLPVVIQAVQYIGSNVPEINTFTKDTTQITPEGTLFIPTLEGLMVVGVGDYVIKGVKGEFYPCKPDIFKQTYESV